ncbi:MAG: hypothetical protein LC775_10290, partial [Acidobacteria bacterium]|nr:hypothetical protein [Acidobacteriota bacterium]
GLGEVSYSPGEDNAKGIGFSMNVTAARGGGLIAVAGGWSPLGVGVSTIPQNTEPQQPQQQNNDPCAGKKGELRYARGTLEHITNTHIQQKPKNQGRRSVYTFGISTSDLSLADKVNKVKALNQEAFEKGIAIPLTHSATAYVYAPYGGIGELVEGFIAGKDARHGFDFTNVRTVTVSRDCQSVGTSYPGLPDFVDPATVGSARWWDAINSHF